MKNKARGFTLVELLIVIGVLSILVTMLIFVINPAKQLQKARDAKRMTDLDQYKVALEVYVSDNGGLYPTAWADSCNESGIFANPGELIPNYLPKRIDDPIGANWPCPRGCGIDTSDAAYCVYRYYPADDGTSYVLAAGLETSGVWEICSGGNVGLIPSSMCQHSYDGPCNDAICDVQ